MTPQVIAIGLTINFDVTCSSILLVVVLVTSRIAKEAAVSCRHGLLELWWVEEEGVEPGDSNRILIKGSK